MTLYCITIITYVYHFCVFQTNVHDANKKRQIITTLHLLKLNTFCLHILIV